MSKSNYEKMVKFTSIVQLPLLEDSPARVMEWKISPKEIWDQLEVLCIEGYSYRVNYDSFANQWTCQLFGIYERCPNKGLMLYANAPTMLDAIKVALFKHFELASGGKWENSPASIGGGWS